MKNKENKRMIENKLKILSRREGNLENLLNDTWMNKFFIIFKLFLSFTQSLCLNVYFIIYESYNRIK